MLPRYFLRICKEKEGSWRCLLALPIPSPSPRYSGRVRRKRDSDQGREKFSTGSWNVVRTDVTRTANYLRMFQPGRVGRFLPICIIIARTFESTGIKSLSGSTETIAVDANSFESCKFLLSPFFLGFNWKISFFFFYSFVLFFFKKKKREDLFLSSIQVCISIYAMNKYAVSFVFSIYCSQYIWIFSDEMSI